MKLENVTNMYCYVPLGLAQGYLLFKNSDNYTYISPPYWWKHNGLNFTAVYCLAY